MYGIIMGIWRAAGLKPRVLEDTMRIQTILSLVAVGRGVSLVPASAMSVSQQGVVFRPVRPSLPKVEMGVAYRRVEASPTVSALLDLVEAVFRRSLPRSRSMRMRSAPPLPPSS
jgi:DNA-binding transcriptional LysR family regulator